MTTVHARLGGFQETLEGNVAGMDRRCRPRFNVQLSCRVRPASMKKVEFAGTIVNISRSGILVVLDSAQISKILRPGDIARVAVELPRHPLVSPRCLECTATVVRIVSGKAQTQVALEIGRIRVTDQDTTAISTNDWPGPPIGSLIQ